MEFFKSLTNEKCTFPSESIRVQRIRWTSSERLSTLSSNMSGIFLSLSRIENQLIHRNLFVSNGSDGLHRNNFTADCRPQTADHRLQTTDSACKLKDTKNLPNKGDTIKNITSCESEKVAKLASFPRCCWLFFTDATLY